MPGVVTGNHLRKRQIKSRGSADAGNDLFLGGGVGTRHGLAHERIKSLFHAAAEYPVWLVRGILKLHDIHLLAEAGTQQLNRIGQGPVGVRRVDADNTGDAVNMSEWHLPDDKSAPVVADENSLVDLEMIHQAD